MPKAPYIVAFWNITELSEITVLRNIPPILVFHRYAKLIHRLNKMGENLGEEIKSGELKSKTSRRTNVNTYENARFYGNLMIARASEPFGTKRSQVQILSPRPPKDTDIDTMSVFFLFAVSSVEDANIG